MEDAAEYMLQIDLEDDGPRVPCGLHASRMPAREEQRSSPAALRGPDSTTAPVLPRESRGSGAVAEESHAATLMTTLSGYRGWHDFETVKQR
jgi:hypothetical protein